MFRSIVAIFFACLFWCAPALADTTSYTLTQAQQKVGIAGTSVIVFYSSSATFTTSTGAPSGSNGGLQVPDGTFLPLYHDHMMAMATGVLAYVNACYAVEADVVSKIAAGTVTTKAVVDGSAWPSAILTAT